MRFGKLLNSPRTFFFVTYSGTLGRNPFNAISTLPGEALRSGDFAGRPALYDPLGNLPFARVYSLVAKLQSQASEQLPKPAPAADGGRTVQPPGAGKP